MTRMDMIVLADLYDAPVDPATLQFKAIAARKHRSCSGCLFDGPERVAALESNNEVHKWTHDEVRGIRDNYRALVNKMMKESKECSL